VTVASLDARRSAVVYELWITHHWDGRIEIWQKGLSESPRTDAALAAALRQYADSLDGETP
jgi:hypothetical protein